MAQSVSFTPQPITIASTGTNTVTTQPLWDVVDVSAFDILDVEFGIVYLTNTIVATPSIQTSMQRQIDSSSSGGGDSSWVTVATLSAQTGSAAYQAGTPWQKVSFGSGSGQNPGMLRYVRWAIQMSAAGTVVFFVRGMARRLGSG